MQLLYEHSQQKNLTMAEIYDDLFDFLKNKAKTSTWNAKDLVLKYLDELVGGTLDLNFVPFQNVTVSDTDWKYFNVLTNLYTTLMESSDEAYNWSIENVGSFFIKGILGQFKVQTTLDILFRQITTFIKVCIVFVFGLQTH